MTESKRWKEIDALYTIGIILVLIGHSHSSDWSVLQGTALERLIQFIYTFHMPLFYFVSGFLFQNSGALRAKGYRRWIGEKAIRLLTPYFFWSLLAAAPKYYLEHGSLDGLGAVIAAVFVNPRAGVWGHFWFLPVIFLTYAVFGLLRSAGKDDLKTSLCALAAALLLYFLPIRSNLLGYSDLRASLLFFAVGVLVRRAWEGKSRTPLPKWGALLGAALCLIITGLCVVFTDAALNKPAAGLLTALLMLAVCWFAAEHMNLGSWFSEHNLTLYMFSWFFQSAAMVLCAGLSRHSTFLIMFFAGLCGPSAVIFLYQKLPFLHRRFIRILLGMR